MSLKGLREKAEYLRTDTIRLAVPAIYAMQEKMTEFLTANKGFMSITSIQVNSKLPVFMFKDSGRLEYCINPIIKRHWNKPEESLERCDTLPGIYCFVNRDTRISVEYLTINHQKKIKIKKSTLSGLKARIFQQALEQLHGIVWLDKASVIPEGKTKANVNKIYRIESSTYGKDYFAEGANELFFSGLSIEPLQMVKEHVGVRL